MASWAPQPSTVAAFLLGLDERGAYVVRQRGDPLGDAGRGRAQLGRDLVHRAQPGELEQ